MARRGYRMYASSSWAERWGGREEGRGGVCEGGQGRGGTQVAMSRAGHMRTPWYPISHPCTLNPDTTHPAKTPTAISLPKTPILAAPQCPKTLMLAAPQCPKTPILAAPQCPQTPILAAPQVSGIEAVHSSRHRAKTPEAISHL